MYVRALPRVDVLVFSLVFNLFVNQKHYLLCLWPHKTQQKKETYKPCMNTKQVVEIHRCYFINTATLLKHAAIKGCSRDKNVGKKSNFRKQDLTNQQLSFPAHLIYKLCLMNLAKSIT